MQDATEERGPPPPDETQDGTPDGAQAEADDGPGGRIARLPLGIVIRRQPGVTRWAQWAWRAVAVLPGAGPADWREMRREGEAVEYHAATVTLEVHRALVEGYRVTLAGDPPSVWVILRPAPGSRGFEVHGVTASAFEAQDYADGTDIVEPVPMPPQLIAWLSAFVGRHRRDEVFVKRQRRKGAEAGAAGEQPRARPAGDVYRAPTAHRKDRS